MEKRKHEWHRLSGRSIAVVKSSCFIAAVQQDTTYSSNSRCMLQPSVSHLPFTTMKTTLLLTFLACVLLIPFRAAAEPAELTAARMAYEGKLIIPKGKLDAALEARGKQYAVFIKALEDRAALDARLDAVILLKAEREAYEQGKRTNGFGPNASKVAPEARDARRLLEGDFARLRATVAPEGRRLAGEYVKTLEGIERKLTMQKDVAGAVEIRKKRTAIQQDGMDPFARDAMENSALHRHLLNTTWKWWEDERITFLAGGKALWSVRNEFLTWKVTDPTLRTIEGVTVHGQKYSITFDAEFSSGSIVENSARARKTTQILKGK